MLDGARGALVAAWGGALLVLLLAWFGQLAAAADIISSSKLESCIANGTQGANSSILACRQKLIVVLTVDSGDSIANQELSFQLSCIGSPTGACPCPCNYAADPSCTCRDLAATLSVTVTKSPLWASYPMMYLQSFNYKPYEAIVRPGAGNCKDGNFELAPTCGWYYSLGQKVPDSQGFVCECETGLIWDSTFGTNTQRTRANLDCDFFSDPLDILIGRLPCSAHCLMMDPHWYGGYSLGEASLQFEISATLTTSAAGSSSPAPGNGEVLQLSPSVPVAVSTNRTLSAKLLGDLAGYTHLPVLSERLLLLPHPKSGQTLQDVFNNRSEWMLLDRSRISFDGSECDKVGTGFTAFRYQPSGCRRAPQVCLSNQLRDILQADRARIAQGRTPLYLVSQYTYGLNSELKAFRAGALSFALPVTGIRSSVVQLEAAAESLKFITNTSPGKILAARMCTFAETRCGGFEASAARGYLHAWLANIGTLPASYTIIVTDCSLNIRPVTAQRVALAAGQNGTLEPFQIFVEDDAEVAERFCWVKMLDATGLVTDETKVVFFTNATTYEDWPTGGLLGNGTGEGELVLKDCKALCPNTFDMLCAIKNRCWRNLGSFAGLVFGSVAAAGLLLALAMKCGWLASLLSFCSGGVGLSCCGGRDNSRKQAEKKDEGKRRDSSGKGGKKDRKRHSKRRGGSRSSIDSSSGDNSRAGSSDGDLQTSRAGGKGANSKGEKYRQREMYETEGDRSIRQGRCSSTNRRPSAVAAAAAATAAAAASTGRRRSRQHSGRLSGAAADPMFVELEDSGQVWGSAAGTKQGVEGPGRPHRPSSNRRQAQPWDDSATGTYASENRPGSAAAAVGARLKRPPSAAGAAAAAAGSSRRPGRSSSAEPVYGDSGEGYGERAAGRGYGSAYGSSQAVKQGVERRSRRPSDGQLSTGGFADGFIPAIWNPMYGDDNHGFANDFDDPEITSSGVMSSPPQRPMMMTSSRRQMTSSPGAQQRYSPGSDIWDESSQPPPRMMTSSPGQMMSSPLPRQLSSSRSGGPGFSPAGLGPRVQQHIDHHAVYVDMEDEEPGVLGYESQDDEGFGPESPPEPYEQRAYSSFMSDPEQQGHNRHLPALTTWRQQEQQQVMLQQQQQWQGQLAEPLQQQRRVRPSVTAAAASRQSSVSRARPSSGYVSESGALQSHRQRPQQLAGAAMSGSSSASSPWQQQQQQRGQSVAGRPAALRSFASSPGGSPTRSPTPGRAVLQQSPPGAEAPSRTTAAAAAAGVDSRRRSSTAVNSSRGSTAGAPGAARASSAAAAAAAAAGRVNGPGVLGRAAGYEQQQQQQQAVRSPFAAASVNGGVGAGAGPRYTASQGGGGAPQQQQQRRATLQQQQQQPQQQRQRPLSSVAAAAAVWERATLTATGRGSGPRSPSQRPRSSSSNDSSGLSPTGQQQQYPHTAYSPREQQQQQRRMVLPMQDGFFITDEEE